MHEFEMHEFFHSPKNVHLKALVYSFMLKYSKITVWSKDVCIISNIKLILILQGISPKVCFFMPKIPVYGSLHGVSCQIYLFIRLSTIVQTPIVCALSWVEWIPHLHNGVNFSCRGTYSYFHAPAFLRDSKHFNIYSTGLFKAKYASSSKTTIWFYTKVLFNIDLLRN